jgi:hypothetical protein
MPDTSCSKCGTALAAAAALYDEMGNVTCQRCLMASQALDSEKKAATKIKAVAYFGPVVGLGALVINPAFLLTVAAVLNGVYVLRSVRQPENARHLGPSIEKMKVAAIGGMVLGVISGLARLFVFTVPG